MMPADPIRPDLLYRLRELIKIWRWRGVDWPSPDFQRAADELEAYLSAPVAEPPQLDNALKIACAELAGYQDGFEGRPYNATFKTSDENLAYHLWFGKARKERSELVEQIDTLSRLLKTQVPVAEPPQEEKHEETVSNLPEASAARDSAAQRRDDGVGAEDQPEERHASDERVPEMAGQRSEPSTPEQRVGLKGSVSLPALAPEATTWLASVSIRPGASQTDEDSTDRRDRTLRICGGA